MNVIFQVHTQLAEAFSGPMRRPGDMCSLDCGGYTSHIAGCLHHMKSSRVLLAGVLKFIDESFTFLSWQESQARFLGIMPGSRMF